MKTKETVIYKDKASITAYTNELKQDNKIVGLVPTMGALHKGHMSLIETSINTCDETIVTIFVNPLQFGPNEDLDKYPREFEEDYKKCYQSGVAAIFYPSEEEMYPRGRQNNFIVSPPEIYTKKLCGEFRPGHFDGVATVVTKLFNIIPAQKAFFGQKDAQQLFIIRQMIKDLDIPIEIIICPTEREADGLACSSRNKNLDPDSRQIAPKLYESLQFVFDNYLIGNTDFTELSTMAKKEILEKFSKIQLEYFAAYDYNKLGAVKTLTPNTLIAIAAKIGGVRLIDNILIK